MKELSCKTVSDFVAAGACRGPIIAPTVPRAASFRNPRRDLLCDSAGPAMLSSPSRRVIETPRQRSQGLCLSPNSRPAHCCDDHRHLSVLSLKDSSTIVELPLGPCQGTQVSGGARRVTAAAPRVRG